MGVDGSGALHVLRCARRACGRCRSGRTHGGDLRRARVLRLPTDWRCTPPARDCRQQQEGPEADARASPTAQLQRTLRLDTDSARAGADPLAVLSGGLIYSWMRWLRTANRTMSAREFKSSLRITEARCVSTVLTLRSKRVAMALLLFPSASSCTISRSREVSRSAPSATGWAGLPLRKPSRTTAETRPEKYGMWRATLSTAGMSWRVASDLSR